MSSSPPRRPVLSPERFARRFERSFARGARPFPRPGPSDEGRAARGRLAYPCSPARPGWTLPDRPRSALSARERRELESNLEDGFMAKRPKAAIQSRPSASYDRDDVMMRVADGRRRCASARTRSGSPRACRRGAKSITGCGRDANSSARRASSDESPSLRQCHIATGCFGWNGRSFREETDAMTEEQKPPAYRGACGRALSAIAPTNAGPRRVGREGRDSTTGFGQGRSSRAAADLRLAEGEISSLREPD